VKISYENFHIGVIVPRHCDLSFGTEYIHQVQLPVPETCVLSLLLLHLLQFFIAFIS
jgi:hypothetical protein